MKIKIGGRVFGAFVFLVTLAFAQPPAGDPVLPEGDALVVAWVPPVYPEALKAEKIQGKVTVHLIVDEAGNVRSVRTEKSSDARFNQAAEDAVKQWRFEAAVEYGVRTATGMKVDVNFKLPEPKPGLLPPSMPEPLSKTDARPESSPDPEYPLELADRLISGRAVVDFVVEGDGSVSGVRVVGTSHPGFVQPALAAIREARFTPSMQGDLAVRARVRSPMEFDAYSVRLGQAPTDHLTANGFSIRLAPEQTVRAVCDTLPQRWSLPDPIFPWAAAVAGQEGEAEVEFDLDERGNPENVTVIAASAPEFAQALVDALMPGTFKPALKDGRTVSLPMRWKHRFAQPPEVAPEGGEGGEARLIRLLRSGGKAGTAKGLDERLRPLWQVPAEYPAALRVDGVEGTAEVEIVIDREGRVRMPRVAAATREEFGRAAALAASQWVFAAPLRGGQPVDVRVRLPFKFAP